TFLLSTQSASAVTLIFSQTSDIISIKGSNISTNASAALFQTSFIQSHTAIAASKIASQVACINALISSQYLKIIAAIATTAAVIRTTGNDIAPASIPKNPMIALTTVTIAVNPPIICGMNPITIRSGPTISIVAPATAANIPIASLVLSDKPLNQSANLVSHSATFSIAGIKAVPIAICTPSKAEPNSVNAPLRLSIIISAISAAAPF